MHAIHRLTKLMSLSPLQSSTVRVELPSSGVTSGDASRGDGCAITRRTAKRARTNSITVVSTGAFAKRSAFASCTQILQCKAEEQAHIVPIFLYR